MLSDNSESRIKSFHESFYGTPNAEEGRGRRGKRRHLKPKDEPQNEVALVGIHYRSFDDDSMAAFVNSATALVPWNGDSKLLIDRYDVRHLLQDLSAVRRKRARPPSPDVSLEELDYERYRDVEGLENPTPVEDPELKNASDGGYKTVKFDYSVGGDQLTPKERVEEALFIPSFFVPEYLRAKLPTSTKVHQIMAGTAKYVFEHGGQAEIVLRVKQANNPTFGFLMPDHHHHEYFRFLVDHPKLTVNGPSTQQVAAEVVDEVSGEDAEGGLSLLGTAYGDADEEEDDDEDVDDKIRGEMDEILTLDQKVPVEMSETGDDLCQDQVARNSDNGSISRRSSISSENPTEAKENAILDTGDSCELATEDGVPKSSADLGKKFQEPRDGSTGPASTLIEPAPPGTEICDSEDGNKTLNTPEDLDHQVPTHKEPPIQLRRIIDKMVEFISRNGKEFEAIVKERDKSDHRFPFLLPWNEYYPYYSKALEAASQVPVSRDILDVGMPLVSESLNVSLQGQFSEKDQIQDSFYQGVPHWDVSMAVESNGGGDEAMISQIQDNRAENSYIEEGGMNFDAVLAAVRAATRGYPRFAEENEAIDQVTVPDGTEQLEMGSDAAILTAIRVATGRVKSDVSGFVGKEEISHIARLSGPNLDTTGEACNAPPEIVIDTGCNSEASVPSSIVAISEVLETDQIVSVETSAAVDLRSLNAQLAHVEKRKAERLKKARLFAAKIKYMNGPLADSGLGSGSIGVYGVPSVERFNEATVAVESTEMKSCREAVQEFSLEEVLKKEFKADCTRQVSGELEMEKEKKFSVVGKEQEEKQHRHHHKRRNDSRAKRSETLDTLDTKTHKNSSIHQDSMVKDKKRGKSKDKKHGRKDRKSEYDKGAKSREKITSYVLEGEDDSLYERSQTQNSEVKRNDRNQGHFIEQIGRRSRYDQELKESERRQKSKSAEKRRVRNHIHDLEEMKGGGRFEQGLEESKKGKSHHHGKRKKNIVDSVSVTDSRDSRKSKDYQVTSKKRRQYDYDLYQVSGHEYSPKKRKQQEILKDGNKFPSGEDSKPSREHIPLKVIVTDEEKHSRTAIDVPEDIRAKVRAILAMK